MKVNHVDELRAAYERFKPELYENDQPPEETPMDMLLYISMAKELLASSDRWTIIE